MALSRDEPGPPPLRIDPGPKAGRVVPEPAGPAVAVARPAASAADELAAEWAALAEAAAEPNCFAEPWFVAASLAAFDPGGEVRLVEVRRDGVLIGIVLLKAEDHYGRAPIRCAQNWWHHNMFLGTPLVRRGHEAAFWTAVIDLLDEAGWAPNLFHLRGIVDQGPVHRGLIEAAASRGRGCATVHRERRAVLESDLGSEAYYAATVRPKKRKEIRRLRSRLDELGEVRLRRLERGEELDAWCDAFLALERSGWKGEAGTALACAPEKEAFFRAALAGAWAAGRLEFLRLDLEGKPLAMLVNFLAPPGSFSFKTAFDEAYARFSPGVLIQLENLRLLDRHDLAWMDSCAVENHPMIESLWAGRRPIVRVTVRLRGLRRTLVFAFCRALELGSSAIRKFAGRGMA